MIFNVATLLSKNVGETRKHSFKLENFSAEKQDFIDGESEDVESDNDRKL